MTNIREKLETIEYTLEQPLSKKNKLELAIYVRGLMKQIPEEILEYELKEVVA